jgi:hypothetical protein
VPVIVLMGVILLVVFGGYVVAAAIGVTPRGPTAGSRPMVVGQVRFEPQAGWTLVQELPGENPAVVVGKGIGSLLVISYPSTDAATALDRYVDEVLTPESLDVRISEAIQQVGLPWGGIALRRFYVGTFRENPTTLEGEITAFVLPSGEAVVFDGWAHRGSYQRFAADVQSMIESVRSA